MVHNLFLESVARFSNNTSIAQHAYSLSGEYEVFVNITGRHYPAPGIHRRLAHSFLVSDLIQVVKIYADKNASAFVGNTSEPVKFTMKYVTLFFLSMP